MSVKLLAGHHTKSKNQVGLGGHESMRFISLPRKGKAQWTEFRTNLLSNELKFVWGVVLADVNGDWLARFWWSLPANHLPGGKKATRCLECKCGLIDITKYLQNPVIAACEIAAVMPALMPPSLRLTLKSSGLSRQQPAIASYPEAAIISPRVRAG